MGNARRHRCQMAEAEINTWESAVRQVNQWHLGDYATNKARKRGISEVDLALTIDRGYLVEVNYNRGLCLVLRKEFSSYSVCVVVVPATRFIVTTWKNDLFDTHSTLDLSKYQLCDRDIEKAKDICSKLVRPRHHRSFGPLKGEYVRS